MDMTYGEAETMQVAQALLESTDLRENGATVIGLSGDLGAGKTTLVQSIAKALGVKDSVTSPTFIIAKFYETTDTQWNQLIHIDAYRIEDPRELEVLGWRQMLQSPQVLIIIEWPERVESILPYSTTRYTIEHNDMARHIHTI